MKIIFLNIWSGRARDNLAEFIKKESADTDIFCFQEVADDAELVCGDLLGGYNVVKGFKNLAGDLANQATYVRSDAHIISSVLIGEHEPDIGIGLYAEIQCGEKTIHVCNVYGMPRPGDKLDNPNRLRQSAALTEFLKTKNGIKVIGGDFNLSPETRSIALFEEGGYRNLIKDFKIPTTRNRFAWDLYTTKQYYADYIFVSPDARVKSFLVPPLEVSDHLPLIVDIEL